MVILLTKEDRDHGDYSGAGIPQVLRNPLIQWDPRWIAVLGGVQVGTSQCREVSLVEEICRG